MSSKEVSETRQMINVLQAIGGTPLGPDGEICIGGARVLLKPMWEKTAFISHIGTPPKLRRKGIARFAFEEIATYADHFGITLDLWVGCAPEIKSGYIAMLKELGFQARDNVDEDMRRVPQPNPNAGANTAQAFVVK